MSTVRFSFTPNNPPFNVVQAVGAATVTGPVELTVDLGNVQDGASRALRRQDVLEAILKIQEYIERGGWLPQ